MDYPTGFKEGVDTENKAWLDGKRCFTCGGEKEADPLTDTCEGCWRDA